MDQDAALETAAGVAEAVAHGKLTARTATREALDRIIRVDAGLGAMVHISAERAIDRARQIDEGPAAGALQGVAVALKDNICRIGEPTTCASRILTGWMPPYDATVVRRLEAAGAVLLGKTNMDEFGMGSSTETSAFGPTRNPWQLGSVPGGSSGGAAAAVATGMVQVAIGSDTGGSIRQPAAMCGVVGLKPGYGRVSRYGLVAYGSSLDQMGPLTRTVTDAARVLEVLAGPDPRDATSLDEGEPWTWQPSSIAGMRIGVLTRLTEGAGIQSDVAEALSKAMAWYRDAGCTLVPVEMPELEWAIPTYYLLATAEVSSNLSRFEGMRFGLRRETEELGSTIERTRSEGFGAEVKRRILLGTFALSAGHQEAYHGRARKVRHLIAQAHDRVFREVDVLLSCTSPTTAFPLGSRLDDPLAMVLSDVATVGANLAGIPALSVPCGFDRKGLPIGMQLQGPRGGETRILDAGHAYERAHPWWMARPPVAWDLQPLAREVRA
ncbi:MAG: Asp-tRNA(Asn)/Glu-tRNA(Gln) amidotransferase subunit GatA [Candidatus Sericytochromatia bacterium]|nr:Asp-tRNA(Asn)/Glu-tRNA(Gln) amidotransferase subunit GatA [Candidatus Sericytochromatia bacterium]